MTDDSEPRLDIVIYGATGFTGMYTVEEMTKLVEKRPSLTWGVAGRNKSKLEDLMKEMSEKTGNDLSKVEVIVANNEDEDSLCKMTSKARVIVNCVGPYRFFGEIVVKACIKSGTHHVDVSGEPQYMERMQLEYDESAREKGVYIISACGFDSIPTDLGVMYFTQRFGGQVDSVETYLSFSSDVPNKGASLHYGTWESAVYGLAHSNELGELRRKLYPEKLPKIRSSLQPRSALHKSPIVDAWCLPFPGSDRSVVYRTQRYFYEKERKRPIKMFAYLKFNSLFAAVMTIFAAVNFFVMTKFKLGRYLLLKFPRLFSFGNVSHEGPSEESMKAAHFEILFNIVGWKEALAEPLENQVNAPNKHMIAKVKGTNPGYGATCVALLLSGLTILDEEKKMPDKGGVFTPGAAFANTSLVERLQKHGLSFDVVQEQIYEF